MSSTPMRFVGVGTDRAASRDSSAARPGGRREVDKFVNVTVTGPDLLWVTSFTRGLIEDGLVACGNIVPVARSMYAWQGAIEDENLALVVLHTRQSLVPNTR